LNFLLELSNWLSGGALYRYQKQSESTQLKLRNTLSELEVLSEHFYQTQQELDQTKTKLQIAQSELEIAQLEWYKNSVQKESNHDWLSQVNQSVKIVALNYLSPTDPNALWGFNLSSPQVDMKINGGAIVVKGWILGKKAQVKCLKISCGQEIIAEIPVNLPSGWLAKKFPHLPEAQNSYFETAITISGAPEQAELLIEAIFVDRSYLPLATFQFQKLALVAVN
jgi:hypothetical protein